jgi:hypothetical protein
VRLPKPPDALAVAYRREAKRLILAHSLDEAHVVLAEWLDPVLASIYGEGTGSDTA